MLSKKEIPPKIVEIQGFVWLITQLLIQSAIFGITPDCLKLHLRMQLEDDIEKRKTG